VKSESESEIIAKQSGEQLFHKDYRYYFFAKVIKGITKNESKRFQAFPDLGQIYLVLILS